MRIKSRRDDRSVDDLRLPGLLPQGELLSTVVPAFDAVGGKDVDAIVFTERGRTLFAQFDE